MVALRASNQVGAKLDTSGGKGHSAELLRGSDRELTQMAGFALQRSAARLSVLSAASTSASVRARLNWLSQQTARSARRLIAESEGRVGDGGSNADLFRRDADYWTIGYGGVVIRLKDTRGLQYLGYLVAHPGDEFFALDLILRCRHGDACEANAAPVHTQPLPALDVAAKAGYKRRLIELRDAVQDAEQWNDLGAAERARAEIQFLEDELAAGVGLGGRNRSTGSSAERARSTATKGIRSTIAKIGAAHPSLGRHFERTVHTGIFCTYAPDPDDHPVWQF